MLSRSESGDSDADARAKNGWQPRSRAKGRTLEWSGPATQGRDGALLRRLGGWFESARGSATRCSQKFRDVQIETRQGIEMERR